MVGGFVSSIVDQNVDQSILVRRLGLTAQYIGHGVGQFVLHVGYDMRIKIHGDANLGMTQGFANNLGVDVLFERQGRERVDQPMKRQIG